MKKSNSEYQLEFNSILANLDESEFTDFYLTHKAKATAENFNIEVKTVYKLARYFKIQKIGNNISSQEEFFKHYSIEEFSNYVHSHNNEDVLKHFNISSKLYYELTKENNIVRTQEELLAIRTNTSIEKYGVPYAIQSDAIKAVMFNEENIKQTNAKRKATIAQDPEFYKKRDEKSFQTKLERYGDGNYNNREKYHQTCEERFGVYSFPQSQQFIDSSNATRIANCGSLEESYKRGLEAAKKTNLERYGVEHNWSSSDPKLNGRAATKERFGSSYISQTDYWHEVVPETNISKYDVAWACMRKEAKLYNNNSSYNQMFSDLLKAKIDGYDEFNDREFHIGNKSYDFKVNNHLIEINPASTHNSTWGIYNNKPLDPTYHKTKSELAQSNDYHCIHVWDWDSLDKIVDIVNPNKTVLYARNLHVRTIEDNKIINSFLKDNHLQGTCKGQSICIGLCTDDSIIELMTFGKPRYNKNYEYELLRLCTLSGYSVVGGAQRLFNYFIENYNPESVISYCDNSKFTGKIYQDLGFKLNNSGQPACHWYHINKHIHITDNLLRQRGFDQLVGDIFRCYGSGTNNEKLMLDHGFVQIYDCGQSTYSYISERK